MNLQLITLPDEKLKSDTKKDETDKNDVTDKKAEVNDSRFKPIRDVEIGLNQYKLFSFPLPLADKRRYRP